MKEYGATDDWVSLIGLRLRAACLSVPRNIILLNPLGYLKGGSEVLFLAQSILIFLSYDLKNNHHIYSYILCPFAPLFKIDSLIVICVFISKKKIKH